MKNEEKNEKKEEKKNEEKTEAAEVFPKPSEAEKKPVEKKSEDEKEAKAEINLQIEAAAVLPKEQVKETRQKVNKGKSGLTRRRRLIGVVISSKSGKTVKIEIKKWHYHSLYKKRIKLKKKIMVHDAKSEVKVGDMVQIIESRPISKLKKWQIVSVIEKAK